MATNKPRIPVTMEPELFERVTAYRREHGISSQSKAIQRLVRIGLDSLESGRASVGIRPVEVTPWGQQAEFPSQAEVASRGQRAEFASQAEIASRGQRAELPSQVGIASPGEQAGTASQEQRAEFDSQERELLTIARELDPAQKALLLRLLRLAGEREETRRTP